MFSLTLVDTFTWTSLLCRCTDHTLIERIIFITFCAVCKAFCEKHNCFNQLLGLVFINFFKSNNAGSAYLRLSPKLHMNINKISACGSCMGRELSLQVQHFCEENKGENHFLNVLFSRSLAIFNLIPKANPQCAVCLRGTCWD